MEKSQIWIVFLLLALVLVSAAADNVVVLTEENFDKEVGQDHQGALVEFYAPWCQHCKNLVPEYEKLGTMLKDDKSILIGKVDCVEHNMLCRKHEAYGYPTIQWFPKGSSSDPKKYRGQRTADALAEFVKIESSRDVDLGMPKVGEL